MNAKVIPIARKAKPAAINVNQELLEAINITANHGRAVAHGAAGRDVERLRRKLREQGETLFFAGIQLMAEAGEL